jgi:hypothetical protein
MTEKLRDTFLERASVPARRLIRRIQKAPHPEIELWNGAIIMGLSGTDPDRLRALDFDGFWMDESALQVEQAFTLAINRQRAADCIRGIITTSPKPGWTWRVLSGEDEGYNALREKVNTRIFRWESKKNQALKGGVLDAIRAAQNAGGIDAAQELDGLILGKETQLPTAFETARVFCDDVRLTMPDVTAPVLGIDLAVISDFTWIVVMGARGHVLAQERFNLGTAPRRADGSRVIRAEFYDLVVERVIDYAQRFGVKRIKPDIAMHGEGFAYGLRQTLARTPGLRDVKVEGIMTSSPNKRRAILKELRRAFAAGAITVPKRWALGDDTFAVAEWDTLKGECEDLVVEAVDGGGWRFKCPAGGHDDGPLALALAWDAYATGRTFGARRPRRNWGRGLQNGKGYKF